MPTSTIENNFTHHPPTKTQVERYEAIRAKGKELALLMQFMCPPSRELALAMTNLEQSTMWANASIARNEHWPGFSKDTTNGPPTD